MNELLMDNKILDIYAWKRYMRIPNHSIMGGYEHVPLH
jgi:hypothetical protein